MDREEKIFTVVAIVVFGSWLAMPIILGYLQVRDSRACRAKGGVPVLMRNGIICLPPGAAIPLD